MLLKVLLLLLLGRVEATGQRGTRPFEGLHVLTRRCRVAVEHQGLVVAVSSEQLCFVCTLSFMNDMFDLVKAKLQVPVSRAGRRPRGTIPGQETIPEARGVESSDDKRSWLGRGQPGSACCTGLGFRRRPGDLREDPRL